MSFYISNGDGVDSLNSLTGALTLVAGSNITITPSGSQITIAASGVIPTGDANTLAYFDGSGNLADNTNATYDATKNSLSFTFSATLSNLLNGSLVHGTGTGTLSTATGNGGDGGGGSAFGHTGPSGTIQSKGYGSLAHGSIQNSGGSITAIGHGSSANGSVRNSFNIIAGSTGSGQREGAHASGAAFTGDVVSDGRGSFSHGDAISNLGNYATAFGIGHSVESYASLTIGRYATSAGSSTSSWISTDPLLILGNGTGVGSEATCHRVDKDGTFYINDPSASGASPGDVWTLVDSATGEGNWAASSSANTALSNLASTQINANLIFADAFDGEISTGSGNQLTIATGANGSGNSGQITIRPGNSSATPGYIELRGADRTSSMGNGGDIYITAGGGFSGGNDGLIYFDRRTNGKIQIPGTGSVGDVLTKIDTDGTADWQPASGGLTGVTVDTANDPIYALTLDGDKFWLLTGEAVSTNGNWITLQTGDVTGTFSSGVMTVKSGDATSGSGVSGNTIISSGAGAGGSGEVQVKSGSTTGNGGSSGIVSVKSGNCSSATTGKITLQTGAPGNNTGYNSGLIELLTGDVTGSSDENSGVIHIYSGNSDTGASGGIDIKSGTIQGNNGAPRSTGSLILGTGAVDSDTAEVSSGLIQIATGNAAGSTPENPSGGVTIATGTSDWQSGEVLIASGDGTEVDNGYSGGVTLATGAVTGTAESGDIRLVAGSAGSEALQGVISLEGAIHTLSTVTGGGTTGNQTINKPSGTVNFAASASTLTVTNSLVSADSIVLAVVRTDDTTATIKNVVPSSGSFVIKLSAAATAETSVGFLVIN